MVVLCRVCIETICFGANFDDLDRSICGHGERGNLLRLACDNAFPARLRNLRFDNSMDFLSANIGSNV